MGTMDDDDGDYIGLTDQHEETLRAMATSAGLSPAYRETIGRTITELDMLRENLASGLDAVMGPPQVAGFGKRWLSLTVMV
jgi:hypothetical protein